jgi:hypothetical protein
MPRKQAGQPHADQDVKVSIVLSKALHDQIQLACARHGLTRSTLVRKLIAGGIAGWLEPQGSSAGVLQQQQGAATTIQVTVELAQALDIVGRLTGLTRDAVAQLLLGESLAAFGETARRRHEELLRLASGPPQPPVPPPAPDAQP